MADITVSPTGSNTNPFNPSGIIMLASGLRSDSSPNGFRAQTAGTNCIFAHNVAYGTVISVTAVLVSSGTLPGIGDDIVIGCAARGGSTPGVGIGVQWQSTGVRVITFNAAGTATAVSTNTAITRALGDTMTATITITTPSGTPTATITGVTLNSSPISFNVNATTTNAGEATLSAAGFFSPQNTNGLRLASWTGTGVKAGGMLRKSLSGIGTGGMSDMTGGMRGKAARSRSTITVPSNYFAHRNRARHDLRI